MVLKITFTTKGDLPKCMLLYFITSSEFNAYQILVKLVFFYSEKISYFFTSD